MNVRGIDRNKIVLFLDNCPCHSSHYALWNLYNQSIKVVYNVPNTPAYNIIETLFGDLKKYVRNKNRTNSKELIIEARNFLRNTVTSEYVKRKLL